jgi:hypothetical protein
MILWVGLFVAAMIADLRLHRLFWTWIAVLTTLVVLFARFAYSILRVRDRMNRRVTDPSFKAMVERLSQSTVKGPGTVEFAAGPVVVFSPTILTFGNGQKKLTIRAQEFGLKGRPKKPTFVLRLGCWDPPYATEPLSATERYEAAQFINAAFSALLMQCPWQQESKKAK